MSEAATFQIAARDAAQVAHMAASSRLAELANTPNLDADIAIKIFNATKDVAQAVPEKKIDPHASLPTFHITFVNGRMQGTIEAGPPPLTLDMQPPGYGDDDITFLTAVPSPAMLAAANINSDIAFDDDDDELGAETA